MKKKKFLLMFVSSISILIVLFAFMKSSNSLINKNDELNSIKIVSTNLSSDNFKLNSNNMNDLKVIADQSQVSQSKINNVSLNDKDTVDTSINTQIQPLDPKKDPSNTARY